MNTSSSNAPRASSKSKENVDLMVEAGERIAIIGANGAGKTTMLRCIGGKDITGLDSDTGLVKWAENANVGYMP